MLDFVTSHWTDICLTILAIVGVAHAAVKLTPSTTDDEIVAKIEAVLTDLLAKTESKQ